jgi:hypothetical protein
MTIGYLVMGWAAALAFPKTVHAQAPLQRDDGPLDWPNKR